MKVCQNRKIITPCFFTYILHGGKLMTCNDLHPCFLLFFFIPLCIFCSFGTLRTIFFQSGNRNFDAFWHFDCKALKVKRMLVCNEWIWALSIWPWINGRLSVQDIKKCFKKPSSQLRSLHEFSLMSDNFYILAFFLRIGALTYQRSRIKVLWPWMIHCFA